ncbi:hypothetical protein [Streptomyces sp. NBC_00154]|uniref:hypothetical protein n=1 Tax=Streptomyces sp. NBC_00154 TaxID=2975670 RepID=UPI002251FAD2|nr:hypothetical protein [Streptomyces sp. NBC_00154]MCX5315550.1 hypothetical protein [Streptomyces sp. NBC_00154]
MSRYELNEREAFVAMSRFVWQFANRAGDDLLTLLGDIGIEADGRTTDPAALRRPQEPRLPTQTPYALHHPGQGRSGAQPKETRLPR